MLLEEGVRWARARRAGGGWREADNEKRAMRSWHMAVGKELWAAQYVCGERRAALGVCVAGERVLRVVREWRGWVVQRAMQATAGGVRGRRLLWGPIG